MRFLRIQLAAMVATLSGCGGCQGASDSGGPACEEREDHPHVILSDVADAVLPPYSKAVGDVGGDGVADVAYGSEDRSVYLLSGPIEGDMRQETATARVGGTYGGWSDYAPMGDLDADSAADVMFISALNGTHFLHGPLEGLVDIYETTEAWPSDVGVWPEKGDFNGDGLEDVLLSGGETWQFSVFNSPAALPLDPSSADATIIVPASEPDYPEFTIMPRSDLNGDGYSDLGVYYLQDGGSIPPMLAVLYGPLDGSIELFHQADAIIMTPGGRYWDGICYPMYFQPGGDLFGDGQETLVAQDGIVKEAIYVYAGPFFGAMMINADAAVTSPAGDFQYFRIASDMDVNADGVGDLLFSYTYYDWEYGYKAEGGSPAYLFLGPLCGNMTNDDADVRLQPYSPGFVRDVSNAGDISGDGVDDVILSVDSNDEWDETSDYVVHGGADLMERMMAHD